MVENSNPYFLPPNVTQEVCPHCEFVGEYKDDGSHVVTCDGCGERILLCGLCNLQNCKDCSVNNVKFEKFTEFYE